MGVGLREGERIRGGGGGGLDNRVSPCFVVPDILLHLSIYDNSVFYNYPVAVL